jgi:hypothetical protein
MAGEKHPHTVWLDDDVWKGLRIVAVDFKSMNEAIESMVDDYKASNKAPAVYAKS